MKVLVPDSIEREGFWRCPLRCLVALQANVVVDEMGG